MVSTQSISSFLLVSAGLGTELLSKELYNPLLLNYEYPEHQYFLKLVSIISMPLVSLWLLWHGLRIKHLRFPQKVGGGNIGVMFMLGCFGVYWLFWDFKVEEGRLYEVRHATIFGTYIFNGLIQTMVIGPAVWGTLAITWKLGIKNGKSRN